MCELTGFIVWLLYITHLRFQLLCAHFRGDSDEKVDSDADNGEEDSPVSIEEKGTLKLAEFHEVRLIGVITHTSL